MTQGMLRARAITGAPVVVTLALLQTACGSGSPAPSDLSPSDSSTLRDALARRDSFAPATDAALEDSSLEAGSNSDTGNALDGRPFNVSDSPPPPSATECVAGYSWTAGHQWIADSIARFGGVSANGLTLAWTLTTGDVLTADRLSESSDFRPSIGAPPASVGLQTNGRVALDSSGSLLLAIDATGSAFVVWERTPGLSWFLSPSSAFDQMLAPNATPGTTVSEPVFAASGDSFFFLLTLPADSDAGVDATAPAPAPTLYESRRTGTGAWGPGVAVTNPELTSADAAHRRRPTGASSDDRTLFFYDEVGNVERTAWRSDPSSPFAHFEDVPAAPEAAPNAGCSLLYYRGTNPGSGTQGINIAM